MQPSNAAGTGSLIANAFRDFVHAAISEASTLAWEISPGNKSLTERPEAALALGFRFTFSGASTGEVVVAISEDLLPRLAFRDLSDDMPDGLNIRKSRLLSALEGQRLQIESALSTAGSIVVQLDLEDNPVLRDGKVFELVCLPRQGDDTSGISVYVCVSPKLAEDLEAAMADAVLSPQALAAPGTNFNLVMDVELNVTLRFGQRQLALREVLELASGSVVELDRQVDEPIELILDGKVVARGEAVIINGNYGMRVTQVLQPLVA